MIEYLYWGACFFRTLSFVTIILLNGQGSPQKKTLSATFFLYFANEIILSFFIGICQLSVTTPSQDPMLLTQLLLGTNFLLLSLWMLIYYAKYEKNNIKKSSPLSIFVIVLIWATLILVSTAELHEDTYGAMKLTTNVLAVFTTIMGFSKFFPQIQITRHEKTQQGLCFPFIVCQIGYFLLFGIFMTVNASNTFLMVIGLINACVGTISPSVLVGLKIIYGKLEKQKKKNLLQQSLTKHDRIEEWESPKKYAPSTTIYSSDSLVLE